MSVGTTRVGYVVVILRGKYPLNSVHHEQLRSTKDPRHFSVLNFVMNTLYVHDDFELGSTSPTHELPPEKHPATDRPLPYNDVLSLRQRLLSPILYPVCMCVCWTHALVSTV